MNTENHSQTAAFLWSIADLLRGDFKQSQYGRIILPFTLLRRMECVLDLRLSEEDGGYTLKPGSDVGSGKPHDPEKKRLSEIIEALNDIFGAEVSDDSCISSPASPSASAARKT